jgi:hypothetical protein
LGNSINARQAGSVIVHHCDETPEGLALEKQKGCFANSLGDLMTWHLHGIMEESNGGGLG